MYSSLSQKIILTKFVEIIKLINENIYLKIIFCFLL